MTTNNNDFLAKSSNNFCCELCDYKTSRKFNLDLHFNSAKHKNNVFTNNNNDIKPKTYQCQNCEKTFNDRAGLWRHKKKCLIDDEYMFNGINIKDKDALVLHLLKQNGELQNKLIELSMEKSITNSNNTTTNSNNTTTNNAFNLNFFLNETCKDAMNISDFVSSIKLSLDDLENTGRRGYIEGITNIIVKKLSNIEQCFRPIHCSDQKREVIYIKDNNEWTKENEDKPILTKVIKVIANENIKNINEWRKEYPDCIKSDSRKNDLYLKIVSNSMSGGTKEESDKNIHKIISNIAKEVVIDKN